MKKQYNLTFCKADLIQYNAIIRDKEIANKISTFLLKYISAESFYKRLLIAEREQNGEKLDAKERNNLRVRTDEMERVFRYFEIPVEKTIVERIFGSNDKNYMECSVKKLRDRLVHRVNENVIRTILERYDSMICDIDLFFEFFQKESA